MTSPTPPIARLDVPLAELERRALAKRQARAERVERKRTEHLRGRLPLDDPDRHDIDRVDSYFASTAASFPTPATDADYANTPWAARLADRMAETQAAWVAAHTKTTGGTA
jgi:hypothetical protein